MSVFEDTFEVVEVDPDGKKFERVSRIVCRSENYGMDLICDINFELFRVDVGDRISFMLAKTLNPDGSPMDDQYSPDDKPSLMDDFDYVMHGRVFKFDQPKSDAGAQLEVFASFGGLLMSLKGDVRNIQKIELDQKIFCLMRKA